MRMPQRFEGFVASVSLTTLLFICLQPVARGQEHAPIYEVGISTALSNKSTTAKPAIGLDVGVGIGKNTISLAYSHQPLGDYGLGFGQSLDPAAKLWVYQNAHPSLSQTVTDSLLKDVSARYSRDIYGNSKTGMVAYLSAGVGGVRTSTIDHYTLYCPACAVFTPVPIPARKTATSKEVLWGGGVRVPLVSGIGLRGAITVRTIGGASSVYSKFNYNDLGVLVNPNLTTAGPDLSRDTLFGVSIGLYYRNRIPFD